MVWLAYAIAAGIVIVAGWYLFVQTVDKHFGRKAKEANMKTKWYSSLYENHGDAIISVDHNFRIIRTNQSASRLLGLELDHYKNRPVESIVTAVHRKEQDLLRDYFMRAYCGEDASFEATVIYDDGRKAYVQIKCVPFLLEEQISGSHFVIRDITEEHQYIQEMKQLAYKDELTGLSNRRHFYEVMGQAMARSRATNTSMAVLLMDLDGFKLINDSVGHFIGDRCLQHISKQLLEAAVNYRAELARLGGDEFVIVLEHDDIWHAAASLSEQIIEALQASIMEIDQQHPVTISIGIAIYPDDKLDMMELLKIADEAMYTVKSNGKNGYRFYKDARDEKKEVQIKNSGSRASEGIRKGESDSLFVLTELLKEVSYKSKVD